MQSSFNSSISISRRGNNSSDTYHSNSQGELRPEPLFPDTQSTDQSHSPTYKAGDTPSSSASIPEMFLNEKYKTLNFQIN